METITDYEKQAQDFLDKTGTKFEVEFIEYGIHFDGDKDKRDIYRITLSRGGRSYSFNFGQSINCSGMYWLFGSYKRGVVHSKKEIMQSRIAGNTSTREWDKNKDFKPPTPYDVLTCLQKYDPDTFENFCSEFGYDTDSRSAEKTYNAVMAEYINLKILYSDEELEQMAEIQ